MSGFAPFLSFHFMSFISMHVPSLSLAGADADDAGDAGDVAQEVLRMTRGESNTPMFLRNCVPHSPQKNRP